MATLSMHAAPTAHDIFRAVVPHPVTTFASNASSALKRASDLANEWALEHLLDAAGGATLALAPFSFLAWMFISR